MKITKARIIIQLDTIVLGQRGTLQGICDFAPEMIGKDGSQQCLAMAVDSAMQAALLEKQKLENTYERRS